MEEVSLVEHAMAIVERRRLQNRQSQQRYRDKKRLSKLAAVANGGVGGGPTAASAAAAKHAKKKQQHQHHQHHQQQIHGYRESYSSSSSNFSTSSNSPYEDALQAAFAYPTPSIEELLSSESDDPTTSSTQFYSKLTQMLEDTPTQPSLQVGRPLQVNLSMTLRAQTFVEVVPLMTKSFRVPIDLLTDKTAFITFPPSIELGPAFYTSSTAQGVLEVDWTNKPQTMMPSPYQTRHSHPLGVAFSFPWPTVRDSILAHIGHSFSTDLCQDLSNGVQTPGEALQPSFTIWGDDLFDVDSWEVGAGFLRKYPSFFNAQIVQRTNWWRSKRNLAPV